MIVSLMESDIRFLILKCEKLQSITEGKYFQCTQSPRHGSFQERIADYNAFQCEAGLSGCGFLHRCAWVKLLQ